MPDGFQFSVKLPREISHTLRLVDTAVPLGRFLGEAEALGTRLGPLLIQLPPSLGFEAGVAGDFFDLLRARFTGEVACEPRHPTWFTDDADAVLQRFEVARVAADPARVPQAAAPGGWPGFAYHRLHGSPQTYYSAYSTVWLDGLAGRIAASPGLVWCIFDNTAGGEATGNALGLVNRLGDMTW